jgi:4-amino-4-deoxy-L-arabinose transferase-like glycosyltransferase
LALGLRVLLTAAFVGLGSPPRSSAAPDQLDYESLAYRLSVGQGYTLPSGQPTARRTPGTSLVLALIYSVFGRSFLVGRLWFCVVSAATCLALAWVVTMSFGRSVGLVAAGLLAIYPGHSYYAMHFLSEVPYGLFLILACGFTLQAMLRTSWISSVIAGIFWGLAALTRAQIILILPIGWIVLLSVNATRRLPKLRVAMIQTLAMLAVLVPWLYRNQVVLGKATLSTVGGPTFWGAHNDKILNDPALRGSWVRTTDLVDANHPLAGGEVEQEAAAWRYGLAWAKTHLSAMPAVCAMKAWRFFSPFEDTANRTVYWAFALGWMTMAPLAMAGLILALFRNPGAALVLLAPFLATVASALMFYGSSRFRDSAAPVFLAFAALGLVELMRFAYQPYRKQCGVFGLDNASGSARSKVVMNGSWSSPCVASGLVR